MIDKPEDDLTAEQIRKMERNLLGVKSQRVGPEVVVSRRKSSVPKPSKPSIQVRAQPLGRWDCEDERLFDVYIVTDGRRVLSSQGRYRSEVMGILQDYRTDNPRLEVAWLDWRGRELPKG